MRATSLLLLIALGALTVWFFLEWSETAHPGLPIQAARPPAVGQRPQVESDCLRYPVTNLSQRRGSVAVVEVVDRRGHAVAGASIFLGNELTKWVLVETAVGRTDNAGLFSLPAKHQGASVFAYKTGFAPSECARADVDRMCRLVLPNSHDVRIAMRDTQGRPVVGEQITLSMTPTSSVSIAREMAMEVVPGPSRHRSLHTGITGEGGSVVIRNLQAGRYAMIVDLSYGVIKWDDAPLDGIVVPHDGVVDLTVVEPVAAALKVTG